MKIMTAPLGAILLFISLGSAFGANVGSGSISGIVRDPSGAVVPDATVVAVNVRTGVRQKRFTNSSGFYAFPEVPVGEYKVEIRKQGFQVYQETGLVINVNSALRVDARLRVGSETQSVTVLSTTEHVETVSTQKGELVGSREMVALPLEGRNYTSLVTLQPGISMGMGSGTSALSGVSARGIPGADNGFTLNGMNAETPYDNGTVDIPNLDSLAEFRVLTSNFEAQYGNYDGALISVVTKSGTNQFHGDLFEFFRNQALNAINFYANEKPAFHENMFGGTLGGPIIHNKVFFFGDYQGTREIAAEPTGIQLLPTVAERNGNMSSVASQLTGSVTGAYWANTLANELGYPVTTGEPYYTPGCSSSAQCVFPGAIIPQRAISAPAQHLMAYIPTVAASNGAFTTSAYPSETWDDEGSGRVDASTRWGRLSAYYFQDSSHSNGPFAGASIPGFAGVGYNYVKFATLSDTKTFGGNAVNVAQVGFNRSTSFGPYPAATGGGLVKNLTSLGFATGANLGILPQNPSLTGVPLIMLNNFYFGVVNSVDHYVNNVFQLSDDYTRVVGRHTLKFGAEHHRDDVNILVEDNNNGAFTFNGLETGNDWADFLIGAPTQFSQGVEKPLYERTNYLGLYGQDSWRVKRNLTLNYGLRYELSPPWSEKYNTFNSLIPGEQSKVYPGAPRGWVFPGDPGVPPTVSPIQHHLFAPRIGVAYAPGARSGWLRRLIGSHDKTSIRAGYGVYYTEVFNYGVRDTVGNAPFGLFYGSPVPPLFAQPFVNRDNGQPANPVGQPYPPPALSQGEASVSHPNNNVDWAIYEPIGGTPIYYHNNTTPMSEDYSFTIQRLLGRNDLLSVAYVGGQGHHEPEPLAATPGNRALCMSLLHWWDVAPPYNPTCGPFMENATYTLPSGQKIYTTRPINAPLGAADFAQMSAYDNMGNSNYNSLQASWRHTSGRLLVSLGYTYSKCMADNNYISTQANPYNLSLDRTLCGWNQAQAFVASYVYELPFANLFHGHYSSNVFRQPWGLGLLGGWTISGDSTVATGGPVYLVDNSDQSLSGIFAGGLGADYPDLPNFNPGSLPPAVALELNTNAGRTGTPYFNTSLFSQPGYGQFGTANRMFFSQPYSSEMDVALAKAIHFNDSTYLELRIEAYSVFNQPQFTSVQGNFLAGNFGMFQNATGNRLLQFGAKLMF